MKRRNYHQLMENALSTRVLRSGKKVVAEVIDDEAKELYRLKSAHPRNNRVQYDRRRHAGPGEYTRAQQAADELHAAKNRPSVQELLKARDNLNKRQHEPFWRGINAVNKVSGKVISHALSLKVGIPVLAASFLAHPHANRIATKKLSKSARKLAIISGGAGLGTAAVGYRHYYKNRKHNKKVKEAYTQHQEDQVRTAEHMRDKINDVQNMFKNYGKGSKIKAVERLLVRTGAHAINHHPGKLKVIGAAGALMSLYGAKQALTPYVNLAKHHVEHYRRARAPLRQNLKWAARDIHRAVKDTGGYRRAAKKLWAVTPNKVKAAGAAGLVGGAGLTILAAKKIKNRIRRREEKN